MTTRRTRRWWLAAVLSAVALGAAACGPAGAGVDAGAARPGDRIGSSGPVTSVPGSPDPTAPGPTSPQETGSEDLDPDGTTPPSTTPPVGVGDGLGDEPFPELGNPGIDVINYDLDLDWDQDGQVLTGTATLDMAITSDRDDFTLDAERTLTVTDVTIDGNAVDFEHSVPELRITPPAPLTAGQNVEVRVTYSATPGGFAGVGGTDGGWVVTDLGTHTLNEPDLMRTWAPSNDHPLDKATWRFSVQVPAGVVAVANGTMEQEGDDDQPWVWRMDEPMATYLVQVLTGPYDIVTGSAGSVALSTAVFPEDRAGLQRYLDEIPAMIDYFDDFFGPYPFDSYGIAVVDSAPTLAMEHQTRSLFPRDLFAGAPEELLQLFLSHELAHQWFGNAVTPASWQDIWLNEGFATYAQWMWADHQGDQAVDEAATFALQAGRGVNPGEPGSELFVGEVYDGGGVVLHALRRTIGDAEFFTLLHRWVADNEGTSRTTADFIALAEAVSGQELDEFFDAWLYTTRTPPNFPS